MGIPRIRRAIDADAPAVGALVPGLVPWTSDDNRATFVIDTDSGLRGLIELVQKPDHFVVLHLTAATPEDEESLITFAEHAGRTVGVRDLRLAPGATSAATARRLAFQEGVRKVHRGRLEMAGVPLWRDGTAPLSQSLYFRGTWAGMALIVGLGSIPVAVSSSGFLTLAHIVLPSIACAVGVAFAFWQIFLVTKAARRSRGRTAFATAGVIALMAGAATLSIVQERSVPALVELWNIYTGDRELDDLTVAVLDSGRTLEVAGSYGIRSEEAVKRVLDQNPSIREIVLQGPGGRVSTGVALFRIFRERRLATRVDEGCASACTLAFLGGTQRSLGPNGKLGFHRASFPGMTDDDMYDANRGLKNFLVYSARVTPAFAARVLETPADQIWIPSIEELLAGKVIDRVNR